MTLEEIRKIYPTAYYPPNPKCHKCHGKGQFLFTSRYDRDNPFLVVCACIFFGDGAETPKIIAKWAHEQLESMEDEE